MACIASGRLCARAEKLCQFGHFAQLRKEVTTTTCAKSRPAVTRTCGTLLQQCQSATAPLNTVSAQKLNGQLRVGSNIQCHSTYRSDSSLSNSNLNGQCNKSSDSRENMSVVIKLCNAKIKGGTQSKTNIPDCRIGLARARSTMQTQLPGSLSDYQVDIYRLLQDDLKDMLEEIQQELVNSTTMKELQPIAKYYLDGQGKALRPMLIILMGRALNYHKGTDVLLQSQRKIAVIAEMVHNASLIHDDVLDQPDSRRNKPSINVLWNQKKVVMAGNYILAIACMMLAKIQNNDVTITMHQIISDLVQGEVMQLGSKEAENERFTHYLTKNYLKTASLMANCSKTVAILAEVDDRMIEKAFLYGKNLGLAFQLMDDLLDFVASSEIIGKPAAADLKLGLATAPVLFACEQYPELNAMIMRRFQEPGDVEKAFELVHKSNGLQQTKFMAKKHCMEASRIAQSFIKSPYQKALVVLADLIFSRSK